MSGPAWAAGPWGFGNTAHYERMIAVAPELYEALAGLLSAKDEFRAFEGEFPNDAGSQWEEKFDAVERAEQAARAVLAKARGEQP